MLMVALGSNTMKSSVDVLVSLIEQMLVDIFCADATRGHLSNERCSERYKSAFHPRTRESQHESIKKISVQGWNTREMYGSST